MQMYQKEAHYGQVWLLDHIASSSTWIKSKMRTTVLGMWRCDMSSMMQDLRLSQRSYWEFCLLGCDTQNNMVSLPRRPTCEHNFVPESVSCGSLMWWLIQICLYSSNIRVCNSCWRCQYLSTTVTWNDDVVQNCNSLCYCHHNCQMRPDVHHCRV